MTDRNRISLLTTATLLLLLTSFVKDSAGDLCSGHFKNIALYEGKLGTVIGIPVVPTDLKFFTTPTTEELSLVSITTDGKTIIPDLTGDYAIGPNGLTIIKATTRGNGHPLSTSGLYFVQCPDNSENLGFKILVVEQGPTCSNKTSGSTKHYIDLTCSVVYADSIYHPIPAVFTWFHNGKVSSSETPQRTNLDPYVYIATSTITVHEAQLENYRCLLTFGETTEIQDPNIATNAPTFAESCSISGTAA